MDMVAFVLHVHGDPMQPLCAQEVYLWVEIKHHKARACQGRMREDSSGVVWISLAFVPFHSS